MKPYFEKDGQVIYHGDCRDILPTLQPESFDMCLADPPYGETSLEWDRRVPEWPTAIQAVLKPNASVWCFGSLRMFRETVGDFIRWHHAQEIVWEKHNGSNFSNDRFKRVHELAAQFYRESCPWSEVYKKPLFEAAARKQTTRRKAKPAHHLGARGPSTYQTEDGGPVLVRSVIYARSCHGNAVNETQKPVEIVSPLLEYSCPPGGRVIDPFMGSGSTLRAARHLAYMRLGSTNGKRSAKQPPSYSRKDYWTSQKLPDKNVNKESRCTD